MISLQKGQAISLEKGLKNVQFRVSWDEVKLTGVSAMDIDILAILCDDRDKAIRDDVSSLIFYNNLKSPDGSIIHSGDERTGSKAGWDEVITFKLDKINDSIKNIQLVLNIFEAGINGNNFGLVKNLKVELYDEDNDRVIAEFAPDLTNSTDTGIILAKLIRKGDSFFYKAVGIGSRKGLAEILQEYGLTAN